MAHAPLTAACAALAAGVLLAPGCTPKPVPAGRGDIMTTYSFGTLSAGLPPDLPVLTAAAAAESALRARGYVVVRRTSTADLARLEGRRSGENSWDKAVITVRRSADGIAMDVKSEPWGNEPESRALLDAALARIGR